MSLCALSEAIMQLSKTCDQFRSAVSKSVASVGNTVPRYLQRSVRRRETCLNRVKIQMDLICLRKERMVELYITKEKSVLRFSSFRKLTQPSVWRELLQGLKSRHFELMSKFGFPNLSTVYMFGWITLCCGGVSWVLQIFSSIHDLYPDIQYPSPSCGNQNCLQTLANVSWGGR